MTMTRRPSIIVSLVALAAVTGGCAVTSAAPRRLAVTAGRSPARAAVEGCVRAGTPSDLPKVVLACLGPGESVDVARLGGEPTVVNLWASWCRPCQQETPRLAAAASRLRSRVRFVGVDTADDAAAAVAFLMTSGARYQQLSDPSSKLLHQLGVPGLPVTVVLDRSGNRVGMHVGAVTTAQLTTLLAKAGVAAP